jgi:hypothetical protein
MNAPLRTIETITGPDPKRSPVLTAFFKHYPEPCPNICGIEGPTGSGKTGTLFRKLWRLAQRMPISPVDGMRHFKVVSLATTYRQLWRGPIPSLLELLPKALGDWKGSPPDSPASHDILVRCDDGVKLHYLHEFVAIGEKYATEEELETIFRGWPATVFHLVEADTLPKQALYFALNRSGRYPHVKHGAPPWWGVVFDLNAPRQTSWIYEMMRREWREGRQYFVQPPAILPNGTGGWRVNPEAENQENLLASYYSGQILNQSDRFLRRMLAGQRLPDMRGKPIYGFYTDPDTGKTEGYFDARRHVSRDPIKPIRGLPLWFGTDGGRQPGGGFWQQDPRTGQVRKIAEVLTSHGTGERRYAETLKRLLSQPPFDGNWRFRRGDMLAGADPACFFGKDEKTGEGDWIWALERELAGVKDDEPMPEDALRFRPGGGIGNKLLPRIEVITNLLSAPDVAPNVPKFLVSVDCPLTIEGLDGYYRYRQKLVKTEHAIFEDEPEKNDHSHLIEGDQYGLLRALGSDAAWGKYDRGARKSGARAAITENNEDGNFYPRAARGGARAARVE